MGYRDYDTTLKTLNHYQSSNGTSVPFFTLEKHTLTGIRSNDINYYLHPYQIIENPGKNYERVFSSWFVNQELNNETWNNSGRSFFILDKQENLKCKTEPYPSKSDYIKSECLVYSNLTRYKIKSGWIRYDYENLLNENLPKQSYDTSYDYGSTYRLKNNKKYYPAVNQKGICEQYKLKSLLMSVNENKYNFLNTKIVVVGLRDGTEIISYPGFNFNNINLNSSSIIFNKNLSRAGSHPGETHYYGPAISSQRSDSEGWVQHKGYEIYLNYSRNPGLIENWQYIQPADLVEGGYYYIPVYDQQNGVKTNYNIDEVQYYDENGYLVGYKLTGYLIDAKALKISEEIICKPEN